MDDSSRKQIRELQESLNNAIDLYLDPSATPSNPTAHVALLQKQISKLTSDLKAAVVPPITQVWEMTNLPTVNTAARIAIDLNIFSILSAGEISLDAISSKTGADKTLLRRILRLLASTSVIAQPSPTTYAATPVSRELAVPSSAAAIKCTFDSLHPHYYDIPRYLRKTGHKEMTLQANALLEKHGINFWELMSQRPEEIKVFEMAMKVNDDLPGEYKPEFGWLVQDAKGKKEGGVFLVDCGGGHGAFLKELVVKFPEMKGEKYVLQDLPHMVGTIDQAVLPGNVQIMEYDITAAPQEVKGAKVYWFRLVLHALPDEGVVKALKGLHEAYEKGYSKLLIWEQVMPEMDCSIMEAEMDVNIMCMCAKERTEAMWEEVLREGGFAIKKIVRAKVGNLGIIEADLI